MLLMVNEAMGVGTTSTVISLLNPSQPNKAFWQIKVIPLHLHSFSQNVYLPFLHQITAAQALKFQKKEQALLVKIANDVNSLHDFQKNLSVDMQQIKEELSSQRELTSRF